MTRILATTLLAATLCYSVPAVAHDEQSHPVMDPQTRAWIKQLKNQKNEGCCDTSDGYPPGATWSTGGRYWVQVNDVWYPVPDYALIPGPNYLGYAVVWYYLDNKKQLVIRCFLPGTLS